MSDRTRCDALLIGLLGAVVLAGCRSEQAVRPDAKRGTADNPWVIGMSQCNNAEPWRVQMNNDLQAAADKHANLKLILKDAQNKSSTQQDQVREFIRQKVDLLIISPKEAKPLTRPVGEAMDAGIPVVVLDRAIEGDKYTCFIGADNIQIGRQAGKYMVKLLDGKGQIVELKGLMTSVPGQDRHKGFMEGIEGSRIKILADPDCEWLEEKAQAEMNSILSRFPKIDAVYGHNDPMAHGAYLAAKAEGKGREKGIHFIGIDALPHEGVKYVKQGILTATFEYPTGGAEAIDVALKILSGQTVPKKIVLGTRLFDKSNVDQGGEVISSGDAGGDTKAEVSSKEKVSKPEAKKSADNPAAKEAAKPAAKASKAPPAAPAAPIASKAEAEAKRKALLEQARKLARSRPALAERPKHIYFSDTKEGITVPVDQAREMLREAAKANPDKRPLIKNPKTGKHTGVMGMKCDQCGTYFPIAERSGGIFPTRWRDECPKCGYSVQRKRAVQAALKMKAQGKYDPKKIPPFIRKAVEEYEAKQKTQAEKENPKAQD